jgi:hypothetical protein
VSWGWDSVGRFLERWYQLALLAQVGRWASAGSMWTAGVGQWLGCERGTRGGRGGCHLRFVPPSKFGGVIWFEI